MAEVGVHVQVKLVAVLDRELHGADDCRAEPQLAGPPNEEHALVLAHQLFGELGGAVGRGVVDDQNVGVRGLGANAEHEVFEVFDLVVGRERHEHPGQGCGGQLLGHRLGHLGLPQYPKEGDRVSGRGFGGGARRRLPNRRSLGRGQSGLREPFARARRSSRSRRRPRGAGARCGRAP